MLRLVDNHELPERNADSVQDARNSRELDTVGILGEKLDEILEPPVRPGLVFQASARDWFGD